MKLIQQLKQLNTFLSECPHPQKRKFSSHKKAQRYADRAPIDLEVYQCVCGKWHLTGKCTSKKC